MTQVEIRAVKDDGGYAVWVPESMADAFAVYAGKPGDFRWIADFAEKNSALQYAAGYAEAIGAEVNNRIGVL